MRKFYFLVLITILTYSCSVDRDKETIERIYSTASADSTAYKTLYELSKKYGYRLGGTVQSLKAIDFIKKTMEGYGFDSVYLQECKVAQWVRGDQEIGEINSKKLGTVKISVSSLGNSISTPANGLSAQVIEVRSYEELDSLGSKRVKGKIVFFNQPMNPNYPNPFQAYGEVVKYRFSGASIASRYGAVAVIIRSVTTSVDTFPHTGVMRYDDVAARIPAIAISTLHANKLSSMVADDPNLTVFLKTSCKTLEDVISYNVIGELKGSKFANEIISIGGHFDTWDNTEGAHDDGAGCIQSIEVLRIFKQIGYKPQRTIRAVMFMDEEMNQRGARKYAELAMLNNENHVFALEADVGAGKPLGFNIGKDSVQFSKFIQYKKYFEPYGVNHFQIGGGGADISFLSELNPILCLFVTDPTHYFDYHHSAFDTFEQIDFNNLQAGSAAIASLIYLVDRQGDIR